MLTIRGVHFDTDPGWYRERNKGLCTLALVVRGKLTYWIEGEQLKLNKGDVLFIPDTSERSGISDPDDPHQKYTVVFTKNKTFDQLIALQGKTYIQLKTESYAYLLQRFSLLFQHWLGKKEYYVEQCEAILQDMLISWIREMIEKPKVNPKKMRMVKEIEQYILEHYKDNITLIDIAKKIGCQPNYVTLLFRESTGHTPISYLHQIRISEAKDLLTNTTMTIGEIAEYLGYCDPSYFNRQFKQWTGMAPSKIRGE